MPERPLTEEEGRYLVNLARRTLQAELGVPALALEEPPDPERVRQPGAAFVTLHTRGGALRGCIGSLIARRALVEDVEANALAAALEDPRFPPLTSDELPNVLVEVSVLSKPEPLHYATASELVQSLRPGVDGVVIERGWHRATFLPQVWEQLSLPEDFLAHLCYKAGLPSLAWREGDLKVSIYQVQEFHETR